MKVSLRTTPRHVLIKPREVFGREDMASLYRLVTLLIQSGRCFIIISFSKTDTLVSEGIRFLVTVFDQCKECHGRLILCDLPQKIETTLHMTGVQDLLGPFVTLEDALDVLKIKEADLIPGMPDFQRRIGVRNLVQKTMDAEDGAAPDGRNPLAESQVIDKNMLDEQIVAALEEAPEEVRQKVQDSESKRRRATEIIKAAVLEHKKQMTEEELEDLAFRHIPSRLSAQIIDYFILHHKSMASPEDLVSLLGVKDRDIVKEMHELNQRGVLKPMGGGLFNFAPETELLKKLKEFVTRMRNPADRHQLSRILIRAESRKGNA